MLCSSYESSKVPGQLLRTTEQIVNVPEQLYVFRSSYMPYVTVSVCRYFAQYDTNMP